jgi:hypothetical protein
MAVVKLYYCLAAKPGWLSFRDIFLVNFIRLAQGYFCARFGGVDLANSSGVIGLLSFHKLMRWLFAVEDRILSV